jgi:hypothetical protein
MFGEIEFGREFFEALEEMDEGIVRRVAAARCPVCGGPLHRGDYERKPRGALIGAAGGDVVVRFSLCCGREGCRKRAMPPSVRFLGRRVYLGVVVIVASMVAQAMGAARVRRETGVAARTARRWLEWWRGPFIQTEVFVVVRARLIGVVVEELPTSILRRLAGSLSQQVLRMLELLAPITTGSVRDGSRFLRGAP